MKSNVYKSPPVDRLVQHETIAFVGASNDQLPAALSVAFVERGKRRWKRLEVWSLDDASLGTMVSGDRGGTALLRARDEAEAQLRALLRVVAEEWALHRYDGVSVDGHRTFASLWDWTAPGGFVHASVWTPGDDVRTTPGDHQQWIAGAQKPKRYRDIAQAFDALRARTDA